MFGPKHPATISNIARVAKRKTHQVHYVVKKLGISPALIVSGTLLFSESDAKKIIEEVRASTRVSRAGKRCLEAAS